MALAHGHVSERSIEAFIEAATSGKSQSKSVCDLDDFSVNETEDVSSSITQTWTDQAIKCLVTNADCNNCSIPRGGYSFICQMSKVVPVLLKTLGQPDTRKIDKLMPYLHS